MPRGKRFFLYCQHLSGTGHFVRTYEIARALAERHDVHLVDGGRPIPRPPAGERLRLVPLPRIYRVEKDVVPLDSAGTFEEVMRERRNELRRAIERIEPDVVMIEHFPFSKWELQEEIIGIVQDARVVNKDVRVVCSLRDIVPATRYALSEEEFQRVVLETLHTYFDFVLVHADPSFVRLEDHIPWAGNIATPMAYTGYVSQRPGGEHLRMEEILSAKADGRRMIVVSAGGDGRTGLVVQALAAWEQLTSQGAVANCALSLFLPLFPQAEELALIERHRDCTDIRLLPFALDFIDWMSAADLSISQAGYNTCANLLETRTRAVLVPNPQMPDQLRRARLFSERGLAVTIDPGKLTPQRLAAAIQAQLNSPTPEQFVRLDGAQRTRQILEQFAAGTAVREAALESIRS